MSHHGVVAPPYRCRRVGQGPPPLRSRVRHGRHHDRRDTSGRRLVERLGRPEHLRRARLDLQSRTRRARPARGQGLSPGRAPRDRRPRHRGRHRPRERNVVARLGRVGRDVGRRSRGRQRVVPAHPKTARRRAGVLRQQGARHHVALRGRRDATDAHGRQPRGRGSRPRTLRVRRRLAFRSRRRHVHV